MIDGQTHLSTGELLTGEVEFRIAGNQLVGLLRNETKKRARA